MTVTRANWPGTRSGILDISRTVTISARVMIGTGLFALWTAGATTRLSAEEATDTARPNILFIALDDPANKELVDKLTEQWLAEWRGKKPK